MIAVRADPQPTWEVPRDFRIDSASDLDEVTGSVGGWVRAALGTEEAVTRIALPDAAGRLRIVWGEGETGDGLGRRRSARRRMAFHRGTPVSVELPHREGWVLLLIPLARRGASIGVLEVMAPRAAVEERRGTLEAVTSQVAIGLWNAAELTRLGREVETLARAAGLGCDLVRAGTPEAAVRSAVRFLCDRFHVPVAAWLVNGDPPHLVLAEVRGVGSRKGRMIRGALGSLPRWDSLSAIERDALVGRMAAVLGVDQVEVLGAGDAFLAAGHATASLRDSLHIVGSLLEEVLRQKTTMAEATRRSGQLDLGIAWTAHEFRGPLLGVKAVLELLLRSGGDSPAGRAMLERSLRELEQLAGLTDGLLRWAVGAGSLTRRHADVVSIVRQAVESCYLEAGQERVWISAPDRLIARVDAHQLRGAIANLVSNALAYSPPDTKVEVSVEHAGDAIIAGVRDEGPGIQASERDRIFDPFFRGQTRGRRNGKGLGLFIARRVVEAHGGSIWLEPSVQGATFRIRLPVEEARRHRARSDRR